MSDEKKILRVTAVDLENFDEGVQEIGAGNYVIIVTKPAHVASTQHFGNGTVQITLKGVAKNMAFAETPIERGNQADAFADLYDCCSAAPTQPHADDCPLWGA